MKLEAYDNVYLLGIERRFFVPIIYKVWALKYGTSACSYNSESRVILVTKERSFKPFAHIYFTVEKDLNFFVVI